VEARIAGRGPPRENRAVEAVYLALGTNVGDRWGHLAAAEGALAKLPGSHLRAVSPVYETPAVGPVEQGAFLNAVAKLETSLEPATLHQYLLGIERKAGRRAKSQRERWGPRELDLDILLFGRRVISTDELVVPHPLMHDRWFVLRPLCDLDASVVHPVLEMTVGELLTDLEKRGEPAEMGLGVRCEKPA